jgi:hypothetical protein
MQTKRTLFYQKTASLGYQNLFSPFSKLVEKTGSAGSQMRHAGLLAAKHQKQTKVGFSNACKRDRR